MANDNWSPFYPTVFYPAQESTALQREMTSNLQAIVRDLSRIGQSQPQTQIVQVQSGDQDASHQIGASINDLRESLGRDLGGLRNELGGLSSQLEWSIGLLHESIVEQTDVLLTIAKQQRIPTELKVREYLTGAQEMMSQLASDIQSSRLDQNQIEQKFTAIDSRFIEAMNPLPRASLMYAILLARAELYLLVDKDNEALAFLEQSLLYAPQDESFDYSSYSYRLMGRIVFAQGSALKAEGYLGKAIHLSPGYAIAWYDRAQYLASTSAELATLSLRNAIEMDEGFMLLASIEPNFNPIRKEVDAIQQEIRTKHEEAFRADTEKIRQDCLSRCDSLASVISEVIRLSRNFWQIKKLADEIIPWVRNKAMPRDSYPTQNWDTGKLVARGAGDLEKLSLLRKRTLAAGGRDNVATCHIEAGCMGFQLSGELDILQEQWKFWQDLVKDVKRIAEYCSYTHLESKIAEWKQELAKHDRQKPQLSKKAQKYTGLGLTRLAIENLAKQNRWGLYWPWQEYYIITHEVHEVEEELLAELAWREGQQGILHCISVAEESIGPDRNRIARANQFLEEFQQLSRA